MAGVVWVVVALAAVIPLALWFWPLQVQLLVSQDGLQAGLKVQIQAPLVRRCFDVSISGWVQTAWEHMLARWRATGEPVKVPLQKTIRRLPRQKLLRKLERPLRWLGRHSRCARLRIAGEVGGGDAMESALLTGFIWSVVGPVPGLFSRWVPLAPGAASVMVEPRFRGWCWRWQSDCILKMRVGHVIVAGVWAAVRLLRDREIYAWVRDSLRRKGVESDGRASDSGSDEDRPGESEGHGGD